MGMDYRYAGSASYPRFNDEVKGIVELFGGKMVTDRKPQEECTLIEYFMEKPLKYSFPEGTNKVFMKWANDPFESENPSMTVDTLIHKKLRYLNYSVIAFKKKGFPTPITSIENEEIINEIYSIYIEPTN